jgi:hypothetical protein
MTIWQKPTPYELRHLNIISDKGRPKYWERNPHLLIFSSYVTLTDLGSNTGLRSEMSATNRHGLGYITLIKSYSELLSD